MARAEKRSGKQVPGTHTDSVRGWQARPEAPNELFSQRKSPADLSDSRQHTHTHCTEVHPGVNSPRPGDGGGVVLSAWFSQ